MKKLIASLGLAFSSLLAAPSANAAIAFTFAPAATHINVGDSVVINASISGLGAEVLSGYDLNFNYNPAVLNWNLIQIFGAPLGNTLGLSNNGLPEGDLGLMDSSLDDDATLMANQADSFTLFSFTLKGMTDGTTNFTLGADLDFERNFVGLNFASLDVNVGNVCIAVGTGNCTVPEPSTTALLGIALAGAFVPGVLRRRREKNR